MRLARSLPIPESSPSALAGCLLALCVACAATGSLAAQVQQANYPLLTNLTDTTGNYGPVMLSGTPLPAAPNNGVCHNGMYLFGAAPGQDISTPNIGTLDPTDFQIEVEFNVAAFSGFNSPVIMAGNGWRWIGIYLQPNGTIGIKYNNSNFAWSGTTVVTGTWYSAVVQFEGGMVQLLLNGTSVLSTMIGTLNDAGDRCLTTNDFSNGAAYNGCIRNLIISNDTTLSGVVPLYQSNSAVSSLDVDGVTGTSFTSAASSACVGQTVNMNSSGTGNYEIGIAFAPSISGGLVSTAAGQVVNLNISDPSLFYLNGGASVSLIPHPGTFTLGLTAPNVLVATGQQMVTDAGHPDGFQLSQAPELTVTVGGGNTPVTLQDDNFVQMMLAGPPLCATSVDFYGTTFTEFFVESNGGVTFQMGSGDFTATSGEWQTQMPRIGISADLEPNNYGTVTVTNNGNAGIGDWITIAYSNVTEWGTTGMGVTSFNVELHGPNGHEIGGFTTDGTWGTTPVVGGITLGAGGTHPALVSFDALFGTGLQANVLSTDSVIDENTGGMLANTNGWTSIQFPLFDGSAYLVQ